VQPVGKLNNLLTSSLEIAGDALQGPIGPNQYTMRFPTPREVERDVCYWASMKLKTAEATISLSPRTAYVGSKAPLQKAWVKISNIPLDKRC
jgi:hypothetical protein